MRRMKMQFSWLLSSTTLSIIPSLASTLVGAGENWWGSDGLALSVLLGLAVLVLGLGNRSADSVEGATGARCGGGDDSLGVLADLEVVGQSLLEGSIAGLTLLLVVGGAGGEDIDHHDHAVSGVLSRRADESLHADVVHLHREGGWALLSAVLDGELAIVGSGGRAVGISASIAVVAASIAVVATSIAVLATTEKVGKAALLLDVAETHRASTSDPQLALWEVLSGWSWGGVVDGNDTREDLVVGHVGLLQSC